MTIKKYVFVFAHFVFAKQPLTFPTNHGIFTIGN